MTATPDPSLAPVAVWVTNATGFDRADLDALMDLLRLAIVVGTTVGMLVVFGVFVTGVAVGLRRMR